MENSALISRKHRRTSWQFHGWKVNSTWSWFCFCISLFHFVTPFYLLICGIFFIWVNTNFPWLGIDLNVYCKAESMSMLATCFGRKREIESTDCIGSCVHVPMVTSVGRTLSSSIHYSFVHVQSGCFCVYCQSALLVYYTIIILLLVHGMRLCVFCNRASGCGTCMCSIAIFTVGAMPITSHLCYTQTHRQYKYTEHEYWKATTPTTMTIPLR